MDIIRDKFIQFIKTYISFVISLLLCAIYLTIDLLVFNVETDANIVIPKAVIYLFMSTTINVLFRRQGLIYGNMEESFVLTKEEYDQVVDSVDTNRLDDFCDIKNDNRKVVLCKQKLKSVKLKYEKYENGEYEVISKEDKKRYSKRQLKAIKYCNTLEVEVYDADYLTKDIETDKNFRAKNVSQSKYMASKNTESIFIGAVTSIAFAYLSVSLAQDISWANLFYSAIKVVSWLASGVVSLVSAYTFVTITYKETLKDKIRKLKEYKIWFNNQKEN